MKERQKLVSELCMGKNKTIMRESRDSDRFQVNVQVQSHALLRQGFGTSVPFMYQVSLQKAIANARVELYAVANKSFYIDIESYAVLP